MDQVVVDGKTYIAAKRAAIEFGYAQDYIGQLARGGLIDARRVSGQWYVFPESLQAYKTKAETSKREPPKYQPDPNVEATLDVEGKEYISAALAAKLTTYNQDYVGQLARAGKVPSRQIGTRWYIARDAILSHKNEKDALLRAVQAESVGLFRPPPRSPVSAHYAAAKPLEELLDYHSENSALFPEMSQQADLKALRLEESVETEALQSAESRIPIRVLREEREPEAERRYTPQSKNSVSIPGKTIFCKLFLTSAFSIVIVLAVGVGALNRGAIYASLYGTESNQTASAGSASGRVVGLIEAFLTKELVYIRSN